MLRWPRVFQDPRLAIFGPGQEWHDRQDPQQITGARDRMPIWAARGHGCTAPAGERVAQII